VLKGAVVGQDLQQRQQGWEDVLQGLVQGEDLACGLGPDGARRITIVDLAVLLQQVDDGEVRRGLAIGHRGALQHPPALRAVGVDHLVDQAGLPHARLSYQGDHLALPGLRLGQGMVHRRQLVLPSHKGCQAPRGGGLQAPAQRTGTHQLKHRDRLRQALHRHRPQRGHLHQALHQL